MGWRKRVREIASRNPDAVHPILRDAPLDEAWDSVAWQTQAEGEVSAESAAQPILVVLRWLKQHRLLTKRGTEGLKAGEQGGYEGLSLARPMVVERGRKFLDQHYSDWHAVHGINLIMGGASEKEAGEALEMHWRGGR